MRNLIKYFKYYYSLTNGRILVFIFLSITSSIFMTVAGGFMYALLQFDQTKLSNGIITQAVFKFRDYLAIENSENELALFLGFVSIAFMFSCAFACFVNIYIARIESTLYRKLQLDTIYKLFNSDYQFYLTQNMGNINNIIIQQIKVVAKGFKFYASIFKAFFDAMPFLLISVLENWTITIIMFSVGLPFLVIIRYINSKTKQISIDQAEEFGFLSNVLIQALSHLKYLKSTETYPSILNILALSCSRLSVFIRKIALWGSLNEFGIRPFLIIVICGIIYYQVAILDVSVVVAVSTLAILYAGVNRLMALPVSLQKFMISLGGITAYENLKYPLYENQLEVSNNFKDPDFSGEIKFDNISFAYSTRDENVLNEVNISIESKTTVAFVGGSGAGKSTIVNLITGLLCPSKGILSMSGVNYNEIDQRQLRNGIGYVPQESAVFNDTIKNNLTLWNDSISDEQIKTACRKAHLDLFLKEQPDGLETMLGDNGLNISGGQRQRIAIAREFVRNTPILILDEATSALDSQTEQSIQKNIDEFKGEKTIIIIAHRLSTVRNSDCIYVLDKGTVAESGTYNELINQNGLFKEMADRQSLE